jgi:hypothetical protein
MPGLGGFSVYLGLKAAQVKHDEDGCGGETDEQDDHCRDLGGRLSAGERPV